MHVADYFKRGWAEVQEHLVGWIVLYAVFVAVALGTCGLGGILMPNVLREIRAVHEERRPPALGALFRMDRASDDIVNYLVYFGAMTLGGAAGGIGGSVAAVLLQFQMPLAAEDRYAPLDNARISLKHVVEHLGDHVLFMLISTALGMLAVFTCLLALPIVGPVLGYAHWLWYLDCRDELDRIAEQAGVKALPG